MTDARRRRLTNWATAAVNMSLVSLFVGGWRNAIVSSREPAVQVRDAGARPSAALTSCMALLRPSAHPTVNR